MLISPICISFSINTYLIATPPGALKFPMPNSSKRHATFTLRDFKLKKSKQENSFSKNTVVTTNVSCSRSSLVAALPSSNSIAIKSQPIIISASNTYIISPKSYGIDLRTFRLYSFTTHTVRPNICAIIRRTQNYKFIELASAPFKSKIISATTLTKNTLSNNSKVNSDQPKISSYFSPLEKMNYMLF